MHLTEGALRLIDNMLNELEELCKKLEPDKEGFEQVIAQMEMTKLNILSHYAKEDSIHAEKHIGKIQQIQTDMLNRFRDATAM